MGVAGVMRNGIGELSRGGVARLAARALAPSSPVITSGTAYPGKVRRHAAEPRILAKSAPIDGTSTAGLPGPGDAACDAFLVWRAVPPPNRGEPIGCSAPGSVVWNALG